MDCYDIAIIGLGPAGAMLARLLSPDLHVLALDKKHQHGEAGFQKPCGGLLAPDAQRAFIRSGLNLPVSVMANPQIFSVKTIDLQSSLTRHYQRSYININRHAFDLWLKSQIPAGVDVRHNTLCKHIAREENGYLLKFEQAGKEYQVRASYIVGADGAHSMVRRWLYPDHKIRRYLSIQQWFIEQHTSPFYSCLFDNTATDCYAWSISKDDHFIFGGAFPLKHASQRYEALKNKIARQGFVFGEPVKTEKCSVLFPSRWKDFVCGKEQVFLIGEAAGFISASSLEGISYALDSAEILSTIFNQRHTNPEAEYWRRTRRLRLKLMGKIYKSRLLTSPQLRNVIMKSKVGHIAGHSAP